MVKHCPWGPCSDGVWHNSGLNELKCKDLTSGQTWALWWCPNGIEAIELPLYLVSCSSWYSVAVHIINVC